MRFTTRIRTVESFWRFPIAMVSCGVILVLPTGCGGSKLTSLPVYPVSGRVLINGKPPVDAEVRLQPKIPIKDPLNRSVEPHAIVTEDGTFEVGTYANDDGAPAGEYRLTIVWPTITIEGGERVRGEDRLKRRFENPESPVTTFVVEEIDNEIPEIRLELN